VLMICSRSLPCNWRWRRGRLSKKCLGKVGLSGRRRSAGVYGSGPHTASATHSRLCVTG
jgi:hypothetical protein